MALRKAYIKMIDLRRPSQHHFKISMVTQAFKPQEKSQEKTEGQTHFGFQTVNEEEKWKKVHEVFDTVAEKYDLMNDVMSLGIHRVWKDMFMQRLAPMHGTRLLDMAGGTGDITFRYIKYLQNLGPAPDGAGSSVTVCDINQAMLDLGRTRAEKNDSTTPLQQVLIALEYYACGSFQRCIADTVGVSKSTVSRIIHRVSKGIAMMRPKWLSMPQNVQQLERTAAKFNEIYKFPKVIGVIDSIHIPIKSPGGPEAENYRISQTYTIKVQLVCDTDLCINNIVARWPGSSHDNHVFYHSVIRNRLENGEFVGYWLLGDRGYKVKSYLLTPLQDPGTKAEKLYNDMLLKAHEVVNNTYECWNKRFPAISIKVRMDIKRIQPLIVATAVLHTMCRKLKEPMPDALDYESDLPPDIEESISSGTGNSNDDYNRTTLINSYFNSLV